MDNVSPMIFIKTINPGRNCVIKSGQVVYYSWPLQLIQDARKFIVKNVSGCEMKIQTARNVLHIFWYG
jgi:hypothetical protein